jgi:hypothetical protein
MFEKIKESIILIIAIAMFYIIFFHAPIIASLVLSVILYIIIFVFNDDELSFSEKNKQTSITYKDIFGVESSNHKEEKNFNNKNKPVNKSISKKTYSNKFIEIKNPSHIIDYLHSNGIHCFWHFTHISNVESIKKYGLLSLYKIKENNIKIVSSSNEYSQNLDKAYGLDKWVHLSFTPYHPMYYVIKKELEDLIWLKIDLEVLLNKEFLFSTTIANKHTNTFTKNIKLINIRDMFSYDFNIKKEANKAEILIKENIEPKYILNINELNYYSFKAKKNEIKNDLLQLRDKIKKELNIQNSTLLSDEMINLLINRKITNKQDFLTKIPLYLREKINPKEADYLDEIFECIEEYI